MAHRPKKALKKKRKARAPTGIHPGELMSEYPRVTVRVPAETIAHLRALATARGVPQWRILHEAIQAYTKQAD